MLYFAYGSNMYLTQMQERCPSARFECVARLQDHRLAFSHFSKKRQCGVADMLKQTGFEVWGAVFEIGAHEIGELDRSEGYRTGRQRGQNSYERSEILVERVGDVEVTIPVWTYTVVNKLDPNPSPSQAYMQLIVDGARMWRLPTAYIQQLEAIEFR